MNLQDLGNLGEFLAAIATIATLFYLAIQIRDSTRATKAATWDTSLSDWRQHQRETFVLHPDNASLWRRGMADFKTLSNDEKTRLNYIFQLETALVMNTCQQAESGNINPTQLEPSLDYFSSESRTPGGMVWWDEFSAICDPPFLKRMNAHIQKTIDQPTLIELISFYRDDRVT